MFTIIKVGYNPDISDKTKDWIKSMVNPSMIDADDGSSSQYPLDAIKTVIDDVFYVLPDKDADVFQEAHNQNVEYFEF